MKRENLNNSNDQTKKIKKDHPFFTTSMVKTSVKWVNTIDSVLIAKSNIKTLDKNKVAAFDLDGTLITTKSGRVFPKDEHDWLWWNSTVPKRLEKLNREGYEIVIFSNQNGLNNDKKIQGFQSKIQMILSQVNIPILFMAALKKDEYRKPLTGMWDWFIKQSTVNIDRDASFYIGDAAGRQAGWQQGAKKDHSCVDRKFANNLHIQFQTPEEFFLSQPKVAFQWEGFNAKEYNKMSLPLYEPEDTPLTIENGNEVIVCVGYPASGKSSFVKRYLKGYTYINQDTLKTKEKCLIECKKALSRHESVVIDNTNPEIATRKLYIQLAREANVPVRCFYFGDDEALAQHNNIYRALYKPTEKRELLSSMVYVMMRKKLQEPTVKEGFHEIKKINFKFEGSDIEKALWQQWLK